MDIRRKGIGVRQVVSAIENAIVELMKDYSVEASPRLDAPGVYVNGAKLCSLGLRIRKGCSFHGLALNVSMDIEPFSRINPCGLEGIAITQTADLGGPNSLAEIQPALLAKLIK
ncbi:MAG: lipoyl(octanoyl) transferase LipB, partial [Geopsychrobacter sp.]|nr:lipoyl(octanoyl) transferase LipB [Geopsychrobacter sp.]